MNGERWVAIADLPGYEVSDAGHVRSSVPWKGRTGTRILKQATNPDGYLIVRPRNPSGKTVTMTVHSIVAEAFLGARPEGQMVCHWNGDKTDNRVANLRYGTRRENSLDSLRHGTHYPGSLTHCKRGHEFSGANLYIYPSSGKRMCRACNAMRARAKRAA